MAEGPSSPENSTKINTNLDRGLVPEALDKDADNTIAEFLGSDDPLDKADLERVASKAAELMIYLERNLPLDIFEKVLIAEGAKLERDARREAKRAEEEEKKAKKAEEDALRDPLTGLLNQAYYETHFPEEFDKLNQAHMLNVLFIDTDGFKEFNDTLGHSIGDRVLQEVAEQIKKFTREDDLKIRRSGDEFAIIIKDAEPNDILERSNLMNEELKKLSFGLPLSVSIGIASNMDENGNRLGREDIFSRAEIAMYISKQTKGISTIYEPGMKKPPTVPGQKVIMADFVHLHNHSEYSLLDGLAKIKDLVGRAKELGMKSIAITDHGNFYGVIKFYKECQAQGIKPIIGCEVYVANRSLLNKEAGVDKGYNHLILLAENETGYKNLMKIITVSHLDGYYYKPRTDINLLEKYHEGLICLSACISGYVTEPLIEGKDGLAESRAIKLSEIFGPDHFYLEIQRHKKVPNLELANEKLITLSRKLGLPVVATNDNHYIRRDDAEAHEILLCIQTQNTILEKNRGLTMLDSPDFYIKSTEEMEGLFPDLPEALENTVKIADRCDVEITLGKWHMPVFSVPENMTADAYLRELVYVGVEKRYPEITPEIKERIEYELSIIIKKKYETYFLVVQDFVNWAKDHNIAVGPGRGSAAGSLIAYALRITDVDPFYFKLPFERFLNPDRPSAPDIDLDFADIRRDEVIAYVTKKYGEDKVAQIITFGTMEARGSVRDAGRALGMPYAAPDRISKLIPPGWQGHAMTIDAALEQSPDLRRAYDTEEETKRLLDVARKLEGVARHASVHAAGVVIADKPLTEYTPLQRETRGDKIVTQYDMYTVGEDGVGLLKMDFLGLRNLTIIEEALRFTKENRGEDVDFMQVPLDDRETYELLSDGETTGIFQLESAGMRRYIKELKPTTIFDLQAMVALYRPGPMNNIPEFIQKKNNPSLITYPHPLLKDILKESYGVLTYQDDVLLTSIALAGYSWLEADKLRKAMGKKIPSEMKKQQDLFIAGCVKNGISKQKAEELFNLIAPFAGYGFNKAHAACYATIAFRTAYLKAHYPVEFMTALLTAESRGTSGPTKNEKVAQAVAECKRLNVSVLPPDINKSQSDFSIEDKTKIRFGLSAIKNVGDAAIENILDARKSKPFANFPDFCIRVSLTTINKKIVESLIKAGAMDKFGNRASLLISLPEILSKISQMKKQALEGQTSLFDDTSSLNASPKIDFTAVEVDDFSDAEKLGFEKELLGFYLTSHPHLQTLRGIKKAITHELELLEGESEGTLVTIGGIIEESRKIFTKRSNSEMAFIVLGDEKASTVECVIFPRVFEQYKTFLINDQVVVIRGKLDTKNDRPVIIAETITPAQNIVV